MNEYRRFIKDDLAKIIRIYDEARENFTLIQDKIDYEKNSWKHELQRGWSNNADRQQDKASHDDRMSQYKKQLAEVITKAKEGFASVKEDSCKVFDRYFRATPEQIDDKAMELLKSGVLTIEETKALAQEFPDNITMQRIIGRVLEDMGKKENDSGAVYYGMTLQQVQAPHRNALDSLIMWSESALREDRILSDGVARRYDNEADRIVAECESLSVPAEIPRGKHE